MQLRIKPLINGDWHCPHFDENQNNDKKQTNRTKQKETKQQQNIVKPFTIHSISSSHHPLRYWINPFALPFGNSSKMQSTILKCFYI